MKLFGYSLTLLMSVASMNAFAQDNLNGTYVYDETSECSYVGQGSSNLLYLPTSAKYTRWISQNDTVTIAQNEEGVTALSYSSDLSGDITVPFKTDETLVKGRKVFSNANSVRIQDTFGNYFQSGLHEATWKISKISSDEIQTISKVKVSQVFFPATEFSQTCVLKQK